jgi:hypothetical protein
MASSRSFEQVAASINSLSKSQIKRRLLNFKGCFRLDFTETYLDGQTVEKLRHILLAALLTTGKSRRPY